MLGQHRDVFTREWDKGRMTDLKRTTCGEGSQVVGGMTATPQHGMAICHVGGSAAFCTPDGSWRSDQYHPHLFFHSFALPLRLSCLHPTVCQASSHPILL